MRRDPPQGGIHGFAVPWPVICKLRQGGAEVQTSARKMETDVQRAQEDEHLSAEFSQYASLAFPQRYSSPYYPPPPSKLTC